MANYTLNLTGQQIDGALNEVHNNVVVKKTAQTFTDAEKSQARTNIGAGAASDVTALQNKVGNTALPTTAQTLTGAVAEHETDITGLGNKTVNGQAIKNNVQLNANQIPYQESATPVAGSVEEIVQELDSGKANKNGYYDTLGAGYADQLASPDGVTQSNAGFYFRTSGGDVSISDGTASIEKVHGNTIVWNQLTDSLSTTSGTSARQWYSFFTGSQSYSFSSGIVTTTTAANALEIGQKIYPSGQTNHKYYISAYAKESDEATALRIVVALGTTLAYGLATTGSTSFNRYECITSSLTNLTWVGIQAVKGNNTNLQVKNFMLIDLTQMFGAGNEPTTVNQFRDLFPLNYYAYDAGSLLSFNPSGIKTVGFNQWDEQWESGYWNVNNGQPMTDASRLRTKNIVKLFPNTTYYIKGSLRPIFLDSENNYISSPSFVTNHTFTTPTNCYGAKFNFAPDYGTTYNHDICINLSHSGYRNGEYEPYASFTRPIDLSTIQYQGSALFPNGLCSAGSAKDEVTSGKAIKRVGAVDLGSLTWNYHSATQSFYTIISDGKKYGASGYTNGKSVCSKYSSSRTDPMTDKTVAVGTYFGNSSNAWCVIKDTSYSDAASFKAAMPGVILHYELETPIEVDIDPKLNLTYTVWDFGTEQLLPVNDDEPTTSKTDFDLKYLDNLRDKLRKDVVTYTAQNESAARKSQARQNIGAEAVGNKTTSISDQSTDDQYPSAKCVYDETNQIKQNIVDNVNTTSYRMQYVLNSTDGLLHIVGTENT